MNSLPDEIADGFREVVERLRTDPQFIPGAQHVYIFRAGEHVKVGIAANPAERWKAIASCNPLLEENGFVSAGRYRHARFVERRIHAVLAEYRVRYEWFKCDMDTAIRALHGVIDEQPSG